MSRPRALSCSAHPVHPHLPDPLRASKQDGEEVGLDVMAAQVAALVARQPGCGPEGGAGVGKFGPGRCLVWAKSDALLRELADAAGPHLRLGYVVMNETAQVGYRGAGEVGRACALVTW